MMIVVVIVIIVRRRTRGRRVSRPSPRPRRSGRAGGAPCDRLVGGGGARLLGLDGQVAPAEPPAARLRGASAPCAIRTTGRAGRDQTYWEPRQ
eukprot:scaffold4964_cov175-Prasinococcus_capsulatus_cf.AAC.1